MTGASASGHNRKDYALTIDAAKKVAMSEQTKKGEEVRNYFLDCEKQLQEKQNNPTSLEHSVRDLKALVEMANIFNLQGNQALLSANIAMRKINNIDCLELLEIQGLENKEQIQYFTPTVLGKKLGISASKFNKLLEKSNLQIAERDHKKKLLWNVTEKGKKYSQLIDTTKKHKDGSSVFQIKWSEQVLDLINPKNNVIELKKTRNK